MSRAPLALLGLLWLAPASAAAQPLAPGQFPPHVARYADQVWQTLFDTLDVGAVLRPSCDGLARHARERPSDHELAEALARELTVAELCQVVVEQSTVGFQLNVGFFSRVPLAGPATADEKGAATMQALMDGFFPGRGIRYSAGSGWFEDASGRPVLMDLKTRADVARLHALMKGFRDLKSQGVNWRTPLLEANIAQWPRTVPATRSRYASREYRDCRLGWCLVVTDDAPPRVTYFAPLVD